MSRKFTVWLDSGANIHSRREVTVTLDELGIESDKWDAMTIDEKDDVMREIAWDRLDWGYEENGEDE